MRWQRSYLILIIFWLTWFSINFYGVLVPTLLPAIQESLLLSVSAASLLISSWSWGRAILRFLVGFFCDRLGRKRVIVLSILLSAIGIFSLSFATNFPMMLILLFLSGTGVALYLPTAISLLSEMLPQKKRGVYIGIHETALPIGRAVGPIFVGFALFWGLGWRGSIQAFLILPVMSLFTQLALVREPALPQTREGTQFTRKESFKSTTLPSYTPFILIIGATICHGVGDTFLSLLPLYWTHDFGIEIAAAALIVGLTRFSGAIGQVAAGYLSDVFGRLRVLLSISFFSIVLMIASAYLSISFFLIVSLLGYSILFDAYWPVLFVFVADITSPKERTKMLGILLAIFGIVGALNPAIIGFLAENFGFKIAWVYPIVLNALGFLFFITLRTRFKDIT